MGPKVEAACASREPAARGDHRQPAEALHALDGASGTWIVPDRGPAPQPTHANKEERTRRPRDTTAPR